MKITANHPLADDESLALKKILLSELFHNKSISGYTQRVIAGLHVFEVSLSAENADEGRVASLRERVQALTFVTITAQ